MLQVKCFGGRQICKIVSNAITAASVPGGAGFSLLGWPHSHSKHSFFPDLILAHRVCRTAKHCPQCTFDLIPAITELKVYEV